VQTWVVPFIFLALLLGIYLLTPPEHAPRIRAKILGELNFFLALELVLIVLAIAASVTFRRVWIDWLAWLALAAAVGVSLKRLFGAPPVNKDDYE
jgi:hypothetical protein